MDGSHSCGHGRPRAHGLTLLALAAAGLCALTPAAQAKHRPHPKPWVVRAKLPVPAPGQARFLHLSFRVKGNKAQKAAAAGAGPVIERPKQIPRWVLIDVALGKRKKADGPGVRYDAEVLIVNSK